MSRGGGLSQMLAVFFVAARAMLTWSFELVFPEQLEHVSHRTYTPIVAVVVTGAFEEISMIPTVMVGVGYHRRCDAYAKGWPKLSVGY